MYPNDNRYGDNMPNMDNMAPPMYNPQIRGSSLDIGGNRGPYYEAPYYDKAPPMMQPMYDYMNQPPMMPLNQGIDPRYSNWRESSENRSQMMPSYYERTPISEPYMHPKPSLSNLPYAETYSPHEHLANNRPTQINILQRISYLIKPQLPELKKIMSRATSSLVSSKKKESSKRQRSRERERERQRQRQRDRDRDRQRERERDRSFERGKKSSPSGEWVCTKCSFLNFEWRDQCKKCTESKPSASTGRYFTPGPEDWKCVKCGNLNYARRVECNRCKLPKGSNVK